MSLNSQKYGFGIRDPGCQCEVIAKLFVIPEVCTYILGFKRIVPLSPLHFPLVEQEA
jgi:hypothetical protein